jgi:deazaflavin-dependent oxidoreductase (nitroreductase family)
MLWHSTDVQMARVANAWHVSPMTSTTRRRLYAGGRPRRLARLLNRGQAALHSAGIWPKRLATLEVRGRRSGRRRSLPVVIADIEGERYLVAMLGEGAGWVANVRAAGGRAVLRHGRREPVLLEEVEPGERAPILRRYLEVAGGARAHFPVDRRAPLSEFAAIAPQYPVFRVRPAR